MALYFTLNWAKGWGELAKMHSLVCAFAAHVQQLKDVDEEFDQTLDHYS